MDQLSVFGASGQSRGLPPELLDYHPLLFDGNESRRFLDVFIRTIPWEQRLVQMYGKPVLTPRLTAWFGDDARNYAYSGNKGKPNH